MRATVIALGVLLLSSAFADCGVEPERDKPTEPRDQTGPAYPAATEEGFPKVIAEPEPSRDSFLGWCHYDVTELPHGEGWRLTLRGQRSWGRFDSMGVVTLYASNNGPNGVYTGYDYPVVTGSGATPLEISRHLFLGRELHVARVDFVWCHAYVAGRAPHSFDEDDGQYQGRIMQPLDIPKTPEPDDRSDPLYLGRCWLKFSPDYNVTTNTTTSSWTIKVRGDAWRRQFYWVLALAFYSPEGWTEKLLAGTDRTFNVAGLPGIRGMKPLWCHAFNALGRDQGMHVVQ